MADVLERVPQATVEWLLGEDNPAVAVLASRLLGRPEAAGLWERRGEYEPVRVILDAQSPDGSWMAASQDYRKYAGNLWQVIFLGELHADPADERVGRACDYAFSRQLPDGSFSCNGRPSASIPCLTANVARSLARLGYASDERVLRALAYVSAVQRDHGFLACTGGGHTVSLNGYCHMLAPKLLLFLAEVPSEQWPEGADALRDESVRVLRQREVFRCLPAGSREFQDIAMHVSEAERPAARERFIAEHGPLVYGDKPGWLRFGFPLSYNSDALEALVALAGVGETRRAEYEPAIEAVAAQADAEMRWKLRNSHNDKMIAEVERKGAPSKWVTLRALTALSHFGE